MAVTYRETQPSDQKLMSAPSISMPFSHTLDYPVNVEIDRNYPEEMSSKELSLRDELESLNHQLVSFELNHLKDKLSKIEQNPASARNILTSPTPRKKVQGLNDSHYMKAID
jgi:hypothetical protein